MSCAPRVVLLAVLLLAATASRVVAQVEAQADSQAAAQAAAPIVPGVSAQTALPAAAAAELLAQLRAGWGSRPVYAVVALVEADGGVQRFRLHWRGPGHLLVQLLGEPWRRGTTLLIHAERAYAWFPRAGIVLHGELPALRSLLAPRVHVAADADLGDLFGALALLAEPAVWAEAITEAGPQAQSCWIVPAFSVRTTDLHGDAHDDARGIARPRLLVELPGARPRQLQWRSDSGTVLAELHFAGDDGTGWPDRILLGSAEARRELRLVHFERDPHIAPERFLPEALRTWF